MAVVAIWALIRTLAWTKSTSKGAQTGCGGGYQRSGGMDRGLGTECQLGSQVAPSASWSARLKPRQGRHIIERPGVCLRQHTIKRMHSDFAVRPVEHGLDRGRR